MPLVEKSERNAVLARGRTLLAGQLSKMRDYAALLSRQAEAISKRDGEKAFRFSQQAGAVLDDFFASQKVLDAMLSDFGDVLREELGGELAALSDAAKSAQAQNEANRRSAADFLASIDAQLRREMSETNYGNAFRALDRQLSSARICDVKA